MPSAVSSSKWRSGVSAFENGLTHTDYRLIICPFTGHLFICIEWPNNLDEVVSVKAADDGPCRQ
jgi:hypothetical protein